MLSYMRSLKKLDLTSLPYSFCTGGPSPDTTTYEQAFPPACQWPNLTELHISKPAVGGLQLVSLLVFDIPRLQKLRLDSLILLDGSWEGVVQGLGLHKNISNMELDIGFRCLKPLRDVLSVEESDPLVFGAAQSAHKYLV